MWARVQEDAAGKLDLTFEDMGEQQLKNIGRPMRVFRIRTAERAPPKAPLPLPDKPSIGAVRQHERRSGAGAADAAAAWQSLLQL
jgi:adenylate cyclase